VAALQPSADGGVGGKEPTGWLRAALEEAVEAAPAPTNGFEPGL
jgi:hypothetical protein